jgi:hypothetical protein
MTIYYRHTITCPDCGLILKLLPYKSNAGWYAGFNCPICGPYDRVSGYFATKTDIHNWISNHQNTIVKSYWEI